MNAPENPNETPQDDSTNFSANERIIGDDSAFAHQSAPLAPFDEAMARLSPPEFPVEPIDVPNNPRWGVLAASLVWIASVAFVFLASIVAFVIYMLARGIAFDPQKIAAARLDADPKFIFFSIAATIPAHILTLALVWLVVTSGGKRPFLQSLGMSWSPRMGFGKTLLIALAMFALAVVISKLFGNENSAFERMIMSSTATRLTTAFLATFTAPIVEETVYRGVLFSALQRAMGAVWASVCVIALFALVHVPQYKDNFSAVAAVGVLSLALTVVRAYSGRLLPCVVIHFIFNGIQAVGIAFAPYLERTDKAQHAGAAILNLFS